MLKIRSVVKIEIQLNKFILKQMVITLINIKTRQSEMHLLFKEIFIFMFNLNDVSYNNNNSF